MSCAIDGYGFLICVGDDLKIEGMHVKELFEVMSIVLGNNTRWESGGGDGCERICY